VATATGVLVDLTGRPWLAVATTSLSFALYHGGLALGSANVLLDLGGGLVLGTVYVRTHDTWLAAASHAAFVTALLPAGGDPSEDRRPWSTRGSS
jgi:membrane protease YdiL (CAAX protease family)